MVVHRCSGSINTVVQVVLDRHGMQQKEEEGRKVRISALRPSPLPYVYAYCSYVLEPACVVLLCEQVPLPLRGASRYPPGTVIPFTSTLLSWPLLVCVFVHSLVQLSCVALLSTALCYSIGDATFARSPCFITSVYPDDAVPETV